VDTVETGISEICPLRFQLWAAYLTEVLARIVNGHPNSDIDRVLPWPTDGQTSKQWPENNAYASTPDECDAWFLLPVFAISLMAQPTWDLPCFCKPPGNRRDGEDPAKKQLNVIPRHPRPLTECERVEAERGTKDTLVKLKHPPA